MKNKALSGPEGLRPLFLAIARASVATSVAGCVPEPIVGDEDSPVDGGAPALGHEAGTTLSDATTGEAGATADAAADAAIDTGEGDAWERIPCEANIVTADNASTTRATDAISVYLDLRNIEGRVLYPDQRFTQEIARSGRACSGVSQLAACEQQIASLKASASCPVDKCYFAIAGSGDASTRLDTRAELLDLLGSIDAVADAVLLAAFDGHGLCAGGSLDPRDIGTEARATSQGYELRITREQCGGELYREHLTIAADGTLKLVSHVMLAHSMCVVGRRPAGLRAGAARTGRTRIGAFLAQAAHLEAASVYAFYKLLRELRALGAPEPLRSATLDAMLDEVHHAQDVGELARAYGGELARPEVEATGLRSAFELAIDNIGEGCVRETFGALQATYQAETAADPRVRALMARIAEDESRHAELAWQLHAWLEPRLSESERALVGAQRARVLAALAADLDVDLSREEHAELGFPTPEVSADMLRSLSQTLYA